MRYFALYPAVCLAITALAAPEDLSAVRAAVLESENRRIAALEHATRSVVCIFDDAERTNGGSGVLIDSAGYGLTNFHVVASMLESREGVGGLSDGRLYRLRVLGIDPGGDLAMFKLEGRDEWPAAELGDSDALNVGQWAAAIGNPFLLAEDYRPTITLGIISGLHRYQVGQGNLLEYADCIQVSTSINPGNSGGPLFDLTPRVIGINGRASFEERGRVNVGLGYAITINQAKRFIPGLRAGQLCLHGTLGATVRELDRRLIVNAIQAFSAAERAGLELEDELIAVNGQAVRTANEFNNVIAILPASWPVRISFRRAGVEQRVETRLDPLPSQLRSAYLTDLEHNHAELRIIFQKFAAHRDAQGREDAQNAGDGAAADDVRPQDGKPERIRWRAALDGQPLTGQIVLDPPTLEVDGATVPLADTRIAESPEPRDVAREWALLALPLLSEPRIVVGWEFIGGDEVAERIVNVVEHRTPTLRARWKFDTLTGAPLEAALGPPEDPERIRWTPQHERDFEMGRLPARWNRQFAQRITVLELDELSSNSTSGAP